VTAATLKPFFAFAPFDAIITQPFAGHGRSVESEAEYSGKFFELCRKNSPQVQFWIYQQWPDQAFDEGWSRGVISLGGRIADWRNKLKLRPGESLADGGWQGVVLKREPVPKTWEEAVSCHSRYFEVLQQELERRYPGARIGVIPAGPALTTLKTLIDRGQVPGLGDFFKEFFADGIHLTSKGRYFVSLVHYCCLFGESPEGKVSPLNSGLTEEQVRLFERIAWESTQSQASHANCQNK